MHLTISWICQDQRRQGMTPPTLILTFKCPIFCSFLPAAKCPLNVYCWYFWICKYSDTVYKASNSRFVQDKDLLNARDTLCRHVSIDWTSSFVCDTAFGGMLSIVMTMADAYKCREGMINNDTLPYHSRSFGKNSMKSWHKNIVDSTNCSSDVNHCDYMWMFRTSKKWICNKTLHAY